jgi:tRNA modification GTPase
MEAMGMARAEAALAAADVAVLVLPPGSDCTRVRHWEAKVPEHVGLLRVHGKADLEDAQVARAEGLAVSGRTGQGLEQLRAALHGKLWGEGQVVAIGTFSDRADEALTRAVACLERATNALVGNLVEVVAGEVALAQEAVGEVTGANASDGVLDGVFRRFCIGK